MASQEFLASFAVEIDESGVSRLQQVLEENRDLAERLSAAFSSATAAIHAFAEELGLLPGFSPAGITGEGMSGFGGLALGLDTSAAEQDLQRFIALARKPVPLSANFSGVVSAARSAYGSVKSIFSAPLTVTARIVREGGEDDPGVVKMSAGGRFSRPTDVQVAEDGDAEYIIPVKKEDRAVPLLRQLLSELSPAARERLGGAGEISLSVLAAGTAAAPKVTQNNANVSAPVTIQVHASGADAEEIGRSVYDAAERYLIRTLKSVTA